ncbi:MAG TPA: gluconate 2-dehydrogenase subunit 3 family protein [Candidatus Binataceae bacterium]|nr:gluconate 2-dehydrogenase subunit 3 family protein [Candidatus Binataceae bacterium]
MKRREFLKTSALLVVGSAAAASGIVSVAGADQGEPQFTTLTSPQAATLLAVTRRIFPHKQLDDAPYWKVVSGLDTAAKNDPAVANLLAAGVAQLNGSQTSFTALDDKQQTAMLKAMESGPFFEKVHSVELQTLYSDPAVWKAFGYQGPAYKFGGYIRRGFDDLAWLPNPPESASPKPT